MVFPTATTQTGKSERKKEVPPREQRRIFARRQVISSLTLTQVIIIYREAIDFSYGRKITSLQKVYNLNKYETFHSSTTSLAPWIIFKAVLYTF